MNYQSPKSPLRSLLSFLILFVLVTPGLAQKPPAPPKTPPARAIDPLSAPTLENLLAADRYKLYGEVRNVGQLMNTGGAAEIVDPILKLADPPEEFKSIVKFLKANAEALATARLLFAAWPARANLPDALVAIEFASPEEAKKFAPKLERFLPTVMPPVPVTPDEPPADSSKAKPAGTPSQPATVAEVKKQSTTAAPGPSPQPPAERLPFVISHEGNLVFISDKAFKFEKLHPAGTKALSEDQNFRIAHDRFPSEPVFLFFNVALEDKSKPTIEKQATSQAEREAELKRQDEEAKAALQASPSPSTEATPTDAEEKPEVQMVSTEAVLMAGPTPTPGPTPTQEQEAQAIASRQMGRMLDALGFGEPQWPEAIGVALSLDNSDYVIKSIVIDGPNAKKLFVPFVPQLIAGPAYATDAASVLPDDTEVFVTASIDFLQTYEGMLKATEAKAKAEERREMPVGEKEPPLNVFAEFEKKAKFNIKDELLPAFGNEIALAGSLSTLQSAGINFGATPTKTSSGKDDAGDKDKEKKAALKYPVLLIAVKDREAARKLMPHILDGLGMGEANLIAQVEKREDTEMVNYAGIFAYAFVGNFVVISEAAAVRRVIDATINHQTLSSNAAFRNSRRWEPSRTLGQIYVSPALMEGYQDEVRKASATLDPGMRDFLLGLDPTATAITYALSNQGLGTEHEIHLPKNLILTTVAGISSATKNPPPEANEMIAAGSLRMVASAEEVYHSTAGKGSYGSLDQLAQQNLVSLESFKKYGYDFQVTTAGDHFEAVATPREYGKSGKRSFFVDKTGVVRGDDHGGGPASGADKPIQE